MKKQLFLVALIISNIINAQQWVSKSYSYDSLPNIKYGTAINFNGGIDTLKMDIYTPKCNDALSNRPLMMIIHGGSFLAGTRYDPNVVKLTRDFAKRGYVTAAIEYRLGFISDDAPWTCNAPNYSCLFSTDTAEWYRSQYRGIQDAKGALRYLINRYSQYRIDTNNVFVIGESAGGFLALSVGYLDTIAEKPLPTYAIADAPKPYLATTQSCSYYAGKSFTNTTIPRPDLGSIDGDIEPSTIKYKIKAIGSLYGGITNNLFQYTKTGSTAPDLYIYHQPCDMVVPFNTARVNAGTSWCLANCYSCYGIANTPLVSGGNAIKNSVTSASLSIAIYNDMTANINPNVCAFATWSCADQLNNPCHEFDNFTLRTNNMAAFFATKITTTPVCTPLVTAISEEQDLKKGVSIFPNPFENEFTITNKTEQKLHYEIVDVLGKQICKGFLLPNSHIISGLKEYEPGIYFVKLYNQNQSIVLPLVSY